MRWPVILAMAQQQGGGAAPSSYAAWPSLIGAEMLVNGDCGSSTGWTLGAGVAIAAGKMTLTAVEAGIGATNVSYLSFVEGGTYRCAFTADSVSAGGLQISVGNSLTTVRTAAGTYSQDLLADDLEGAGGWFFFATTTPTTAQLDNFSVKSVGLLGVEADWTFTGGSVVWGTAPDAIQFNAATSGHKAELTGSAKTAFDAAVSNSTACQVTLFTNPNATLLGTVSVTMKDGTPVNFVFNGFDLSVTQTVMSGTGSGCILTAGNDGPLGPIVRVTIALA